MSAQAAPAGPYRAAERIWKAANADGVAVLERLLIAERAAATGRFENVWPTPTESRVMPPTRRLLRDWYVRVVENQLARGIMAPADSPIDGMEAERAMAAVRKRTEAESSVVVDVVIELARDGRRFADQVAKERKDYVDAALRGRLGRLFQRSGPVGMRQALAEQWYARSFRAAVEPILYRLETPPVTAAEIQAVGISLAAAEPRILYSEGKPIGPATPDGWKTHTAEQWESMSGDARSSWLTERSWDASFATVDFQQLPRTAQSDLLRQYPPTGPILNQGIASGPPVEAAAEAFGTTPIETPSTTDCELASILFSRAGVTLPRQLLGKLPEAHAVEASLDALHSANTRKGEMRGHSRRHPYWADDQQRDRAVELRKSGMSFRAIGNQLGISGDQVANGLRSDSTIAEELVRKPHRPEWTEERLRVAAYLRSQGHTYQQIATVFGYRAGETIRYALTVHGPALRIDPVTGRTIPVGEPMPDPHRWAPRLSPWNGAPRTGEIPAVIAERRQRHKVARAETIAGIREEDQAALMQRMIKRRDAITEEAGLPEEGGPNCADPKTRHR
ncbi:hypothetical protein [Microlunatus sp. Gsoil 973]|uniref:hypothetical protein n=1 Tax=Microlunatus sp. Gsoil 973 TaxID=2672569 RepID=UPI0012B4EF86|nr:hypothetical protein [Microlunatus sp. Gsoil 973]QGN34486.1 hypothetical protein GJV80_18555 [Microlunatus sp. Gsoil 973]